MLYSKGIADDTLAIAPKEVSDSNFHKSKKAQMQNDPGGPTSSRGHPEDIKYPAKMVAGPPETMVDSPQDTSNATLATGSTQISSSSVQGLE